MVQKLKKKKKKLKATSIGGAYGGQNFGSMVISTGLSLMEKFNRPRFVDDDDGWMDELEGGVTLNLFPQVK